MLSLVACLLLLSGCTPPPPPAAPEQLRAYVEPATATMFGRLAAEHGRQHSYLNLEVGERSAASALQAVINGEAGLALIERDLEPEEELDPETLKPRLRAWPIGRGALVFIVHPSNPVTDLSREQLQRVFTGVERRWTGLGGEDRTLRLVTREEGAPLRVLLEREVLQSGRLSGSAVVMPNDEAVAEYVAETPEAIGYLSAAQASGQNVRVLAVDGVQPDLSAKAIGAYPLTYPLVFVTPIAVSGKAKGLIDLSLSPQGQAIVGSAYAPLP